MDRPDISRLNKNRGIFLNVGFITALMMTIMAFNYTVHDAPEKYKAPKPIEQDELVEVRRTIQKKKTLPPPPALKASNEIIDEEIIFNPEPEPIDPIITTEPVTDPVKPKPRMNVRPSAPPIVLPAEPKYTAPEVPFVVVEQMPRFSGCEEMGLSDSEIKQCSDKKMLEYIYSRIKYPSMARETIIEGTAVVSFVVEKDGSLTNLKIIREIGGGCGSEVVRVVKDMPNWIPGEQRGVKVRVQFNLPVKFKLD